LNWLAHILLSKTDVQYQLGNLLADPMKGRLWDSAGQSLHDGVKMHKAIDVFTDSHGVVSVCKAKLGSKGYLKGVVVDLLYDHFLTLEWSKYSSVALEMFLDEFYSSALLASKSYPSEPREIILKIVKSSHLSSYGSFDGFALSLERIESRLSERIRGKDSAMRYLPVVENKYEEMKKDFDLFFPELVSFFKTHKLGDKTDNFLV